MLCCSFLSLFCACVTDWYESTTAVHLTPNQIFFYWTIQPLLTITNIAVKRLINTIILLILRTTNKNNPTSITFRTFRNTSNTPPLHWMIILHANRNGILRTLKEPNPLEHPLKTPPTIPQLPLPKFDVVCVPVDSSYFTADVSGAVATTNICGWMASAERQVSHLTFMTARFLLLSWGSGAPHDSQFFIFSVFCGCCCCCCWGWAWVTCWGCCWGGWCDWILWD